MAFCGNCGLLQPPNVTACPRCGVAVIPDGGMEGQDTNNPTIVSALDKTEQSRGPYSPRPGIVQEPKPFVGYDSQTQRANTPVSPSAPNVPFSGYYAPNPIPSPPPGYLPRSDGGASTTQDGLHSGAVFPAGRVTPPPSVQLQRTGGRGTLFIVLLILFLVGITVGVTSAVFAIGPDRVLQMVRGGGVTPQPTAIVSSTPTSQVPTPTPVASTTALTPEQQGHSVVARYYGAINSKDYPTAYNLWVNNPASYQDFVNGFADTLRDDYQFGQIFQRGDGTVQVYITLVATSTAYQQSTYQGYYIVGQQSDGSWKIVTAKMNKV